jgi:hypothetical protein
MSSDEVISPQKSMSLIGGAKDVLLSGWEFTLSQRSTHN